MRGVREQRYKHLCTCLGRGVCKRIVYTDTPEAEGSYQSSSTTNKRKNAMWTNQNKNNDVEYTG